MSNNSNTVHYKDQMREVIPVAEAFAVGESQLRDEELQQQRLEEEQARLEEQHARLEEQRQLNQERQARLRLERQMAEEQQARQQAEQARLEAERRLAALQQDNSPPMPTAAASDKLVLTPVATNTAALEQDDVPLAVASDKPAMTPDATITATEQTSTSPNEETPNIKKAVRSKVLLGISLVLVALASIIGGICGSGNCIRKRCFFSTAATVTLRSESIVSYINSITLSGRTLTYPNCQTEAEEEALNWLIEGDVGTSETDQRTLRQRFALATLWFANGPFEDASFENHLSTWLTSRDECDWESISECDGGEVTSVGLWSDGLNGQLPSDLALLTAMTWLDLEGNQLTGTIPTELTRMTALTRFWIYNNNLSGDMPFCDGATRPTRFTQLEADCNEVSCPCCTKCCPNGGFEGIPEASSTCDA